MAPKAKPKKKDPNAPTPIPEDTYLRAKKLVENKVVPKPPKGELTSDDWCIPPAMHSDKEFKQVIHYWKQCAIVQYTERNTIKVPARMKAVENLEKKERPLKELKDLFKFLKSLTKQSTKRTGQFLKQLEKKEKKEEKRQTLQRNMLDVDNQMNEELRSARRFAETKLIFDKRYMIGSKLGDKAPRKNALILIEASDKQAAWIEETKDEINKFLRQVVEEGECESFNVALFSCATQTLWCPQFQNKADPKKGLADAEKWIKKNCNPKAFASQPFPPDWQSMLNKFCGEGAVLPWRIYICCSRSPDSVTAREAVSEAVRVLREGTESPAKGEPVLPINIVAFDPQIAENAEERTFFQEIAGTEGGTYMVDTSQEDLVNLDKMLKEVAKKKKQLDKLDKKFQKMEDLSGRLAEDRELFQMQIALQRMLEEDKDIVDWAIKSEPPVTAPEI